MQDLTVFLVSHFPPAPVGHGGQHRTLQLDFEARAIAGEEHVASVNLDLWWRARQQAERKPRRRAPLPIRVVRHLQWKLQSFTTGFEAVRENPFRLVRVGRYPNAIPFSTRNAVDPEFVAHYEQLVSKESGPKVCVIEHAIFGELIELNDRLGIPTLSAFHNLEALDITRFDWHKRALVYTVMTDLGNELRLLGRCAERLVISKVEAGFIGGLGLECHYYPYLPVGPLRDNLWHIRQRRAGGQVEPGLILLVGSAAHGVTRDSMRWFAEMAAECGLPDGVSVVAVGSDTDKLLEPKRTPPRMHLRGWVEQSRLDDLLARAEAAIVPQHLGFGALTRLPEFACAGLPVIAFEHPSFALNPPPGLRTVRRDWDEVQRAMRDAASGPAIVAEADYIAWEAAQPRPFSSTLRSLARVA